MEPKDNALQASFNKKLEDDKKAAATTEEVAVPEVKGPEESVKSRNEPESMLSSSQLGRDMLNKYDNNTSAYVEQLRQSNENLKQAGMSYTEYVDGIMNEVKRQAEEQRKQNEAEAKQDRRLQLFGSITEAAANLANVIAVSKGASVATWKSQQNTWADRAAAARKEREAKLQKLDDQLKTLDQQKSQMRLQLDKENAARDAQLAQLIAERETNRNKLAMDIASQLRAQELAEEKMQQETTLKLMGLANQQKQIDNNYALAQERNEINRTIAEARKTEAETRARDRKNKGLTIDEIRGARDKVARHAGFSDYNQYMTDYNWYLSLSDRQKKKASGEDRERIDRIENMSEEAKRMLKDMRDLNKITSQTAKNWAMSDYFNEAIGNTGGEGVGEYATQSSGQLPLLPDEQQGEYSGSIFDELMQ